MERLSDAKDDHRDLQCSRVGSPLLCSRSKASEWKETCKVRKRARIGQYLGFSPEHSTLVALVRHLGSGHVSPQWHVVFDDKFETVFSAGYISDKDFDDICSTLYDNCRDHYVPPSDVDEDGNFVHYPTPLDDIWLISRVQEWRDRLKAERCVYDNSFAPEQDSLSQVVEFDPIVEEIDVAPSDPLSPILLVKPQQLVIQFQKQKEFQCLNQKEMM